MVVAHVNADSSSVPHLTTNKEILMSKIIQIHKCNGKKWKKLPMLLCSLCSHDGGSIEISISDNDWKQFEERNKNGIT